MNAAMLRKALPVLLLVAAAARAAIVVALN